MNVYFFVYIVYLSSPVPHQHTHGWYLPTTPISFWIPELYQRETLLHPHIWELFTTSLCLQTGSTSTLCSGDCSSPLTFLNQVHVLVSSTLLPSVKSCVILVHFINLHHSLPFSITIFSVFAGVFIPGLQHVLFYLKCAIILGSLSHCMCLFNSFVLTIIYRSPLCDEICTRL
jgi:hypothetical protein